jgi:hypothetical protein
MEGNNFSIMPNDMEPYPLKRLQFYKVKKDFTSDSGLENNNQFKMDMVIQYQESVSNIHDMIETIHFKEYDTNAILVWRTRVENLYDHWGEFLSPTNNPFI